MYYAFVGDFVDCRFYGFQTFYLQDVSVNAMILSAQFWPAFREEKVTLPEHMQKLLEDYTSKFEAQKGNRTLNWKSHLGKYLVDTAVCIVGASCQLFCCSAVSHLITHV